MTKCLNFGMYAQLHKVLQDAKSFKNEFIDDDIIKIENDYKDLERKYQNKPNTEWETDDLKKSCHLLQNITCYRKGLNMAEIILQKIGKPNQ